MVQVDAGAGSMPVTFTGLSYGQWNLYTYAFTPSQSGLTSLTFTSVTGFIYLDALEVSAVPEPQTYATLLLGLGALMMRARRKKPGI